MVDIQTIPSDLMGIMEMYPPDLLMQSSVIITYVGYDLFQAERLLLFDWTMGHEHSLNAVSSFNPCLNHLLILFMPGNIKSEKK